MSGGGQEEPPDVTMTLGLMVGGGQLEVFPSGVRWASVHRCELSLSM